MTGRTKPNVSVIVIFFNEEPFLADAIESVLAQTYTDWELILVDDGSTDDSPNIAARFARSEEVAIRVIGHDGGANRGMSASRNLGISNAAGHWITFLDGDDVWEPEKLGRQMRLLAEKPEVNILVSPALWWYPTDPDTADFVQSLRVRQNSIIEGHRLVVGFLRNEWASLCDVVARRSTVVGVGGYEPSFRGMFEDQVFHSKLLLNEATLVTGDWWYRYRQHGLASTSEAHRLGQHSSARLAYLRWFARYLREQDSAPTALRLEVLGRMLPLRFPILVVPRRTIQFTLRRLRAVRAGRRQTAP